MELTEVASSWPTCLTTHIKRDMQNSSLLNAQHMVWAPCYPFTQ